jgi:hypothetical protein
MKRRIWKRAAAAAALTLSVMMCMDASAGVIQKNTLSAGNSDSLRFHADSYTAKTISVNGTDYAIRAYENLVYVKNPVDTEYEKMNIYIPEAYFAGKTVNGYTASNAPIYFPNQVAAYMPGSALTIPDKNDTSTDTAGGMGGATADGTPLPNMGGGAAADGTPLPDMGNGGESSLVQVSKRALSEGFIVAAPAARGRTLTGADGSYTGKAPAGIVDLKAAVRYLRFNDAVMPGTAEKIISDGTSAGGAMSALLGATGNSTDYQPYLSAIGAANARDDIFASMDYCPIINLDHADMAYEWQYNGLNSFKSMFGGTVTELTDTQETLSNELKAAFPAYVNSLGLKLPDGTAARLDADGNGALKEYIKSLVVRAAQKALDEGTDLSSCSYLTIDGNTVQDVDFDAWNASVGRGKAPSAFDGVDLSTGENSEFGTASVDKQHFTDFGMQNNTASGAGRADAELVKIMNPMNYIGVPGVTNARHFRIRYGTADNNTSDAIETLFALKLQNNGIDTDLFLPWNVGHSGDYDQDALFTWMNEISR